MNWRNVKLIWRRELRDQLRDRRTLFMVAVLPMLMYPLLGMSVFQLAQFMQTHEGRVAVVGAGDIAQLEDVAPLTEGDRFAAPLFESPGDTTRLKVIAHDATPQDDLASWLDKCQAELEAGQLDVVVFFPPKFSAKLRAQREHLAEQHAGMAAAARAPPEVPQPLVMYNAGRETSQVAYLRVERLLTRWREAVVSRNLIESEVPGAALNPFEIVRRDIATSEVRRGALWAKLLPFVMFVWALTGAFYPAVDLCAGEKERGTLETLLASPAERNEIVLGKLLTVMCFSIFTAVLNLASMGLTGQFVLQQFAAMTPDGGLAELGLPAPSAIAWLLVALVPISALFSALSLACASFARSTKEGQYYFMPLFLATMPLMLMPMSPGIELNLGTSLVPIMGVVLLLRSLIEGNVLSAAPFIAPIALVTLACCWLATKWAVAQFNSESVLFRESEQFNLKLWLRRLVRDRDATPTPALAVVLATTLLLVKFFGELFVARFATASPTLTHVLSLLVTSQVGFILIPALLFTWLFTRNRRRTLLWENPVPWKAVGTAMLLAVALHPVGLQMMGWIQANFPISSETKLRTAALGQVLLEAPWPVVLLGFALLPAIVEELAFRGFILTGLRRLGSPAAAIGVTAVAFGILHGVLQQSLSAAVLGVILGIIAYRTNHLGPCMAFHASYNALQLSLPPLLGGSSEETKNLLFAHFQGEHLSYHREIVILGLGLALCLLWSLGREAAAKAPLAVGPSAPSQAL